MLNDILQAVKVAVILTLLSAAMLSIVFNIMGGALLPL